MTIYEIDKAIAACLESGTDEAVDMETGEILNLDALQMERDVKLENVACYIKNLTADADAIKAEKDVLAKREKTAREKADKLKAWLANQLNGAKFTTPRVAVTFRKSEKLEVTDDKAFIEWASVWHEDLLTLKTPEINKTAVKALIKSGGDASPFVKIVETQNIQLK